MTTDINSASFARFLLDEAVRRVNQGAEVTIPLGGYSMRPFLEDKRDKAVLMPIKEQLKVGDPILAEPAPGFYVLHRIVKMDGEHLTLRGDGNIGTERCLKSDVRAAVKGFYRKGRAKLDSVEGRKWKVYSFLWLKLLPIRRILLGIYSRLWIPIFGAI